MLTQTRQGSDVWVVFLDILKKRHEYYYMVEMLKKSSKCKDSKKNDLMQLMHMKNCIQPKQRLKSVSTFPLGSL